MSMSRAGIGLTLILALAVPASRGQELNAPASPAKPILVSLQGKSWGVGLDLPGFKVEQDGKMADGRRYFLAENSTTHVIASIIMEGTSPGGTIQPCRKTLEKRLKDLTFEKKDSRIWESDDKTFLEYTVLNASLNGQPPLPIQQKNVFVCILHDGVFVDIHLSKVQFQPEDQKFFDQIVGSISFTENGPATSASFPGPGISSLDLWKQGGMYFLRQDYAKAIPPYAQALELEKKNRQLSKTYWYVLVDNLGMAYGISGDLEKARQTFEYGMQQDPEYPLFYYNMACYYGEKGDAANAGIYLKQAYQRKANVIPGEKIPDPRQDDSFVQLLKNPDFRKLVDSLVNDSR